MPISSAVHATNPEWSALLLNGLYGITSSRPQLHIDDNPPKWNRKLAQQASILDSLARLLVYKARGQSFAINILPPADFEPARFIVAQDGANVPPSVEQHLGKIIRCLHRIRELNLPPSFELSAGDTTHPLAVILSSLEMGVVRHSWTKIHRRLTKDDWDSHFRLLVNDVFGPPADTRSDLSEDRTRILSQLQKAEDFYCHVPADASTLVATLAQDLSAEPPVHPAIGLFDDESTFYSAASTDTDQGTLNVVCKGLSLCRKLTGALSPPTWALCDEYISSFLKDSNNADTRPSLYRWIKKVQSVLDDVGTLVGVTRTSSSMALVLSAEPIIVSLPNEPQIMRFSSDVAALKTHITAGLEPTDITDEAMDNLASHLAQCLIGGAEDDGASIAAVPFEVTVSIGVHAECVVLAELHKLMFSDQQRRYIIPSIGVSKSPCPLCERYFVVYRSIWGTDLQIRLRRTRGQVKPWRSPTLTGDKSTNEALQHELCMVIHDMVLEQVRRHFGILSPEERHNKMVYDIALARFQKLNGGCA